MDPLLKFGPGSYREAVIIVELATLGAVTIHGGLHAAQAGGGTPSTSARNLKQHNLVYSCELVGQADGRLRSAPNVLATSRVWR